MIVNDNVAWTGNLKQRGNRRIIASRQRCNFHHDAMFVRFGQEEDFVASSLLYGLAQKLCCRMRNEGISIGWHFPTLGEYSTAVLDSYRCLAFVHGHGMAAIDFAEAVRQAWPYCWKVRLEVRTCVN